MFQKSFTIYAERNDPYGAGDHVGGAVSNNGDINGDGFDDLLIGGYSNGRGGDYAGAAYVVYGRATSFDDDVRLDNIARNNGGFELFARGDQLEAGKYVAHVGDVNGDGFGDFVVGVQGDFYSDTSASGNAAYLVYGRANFSDPIDLSLLSRADGVSRFVTKNGYSSALLSVSAGGDLDSDGFRDFLIDGRNADYVVYGHAGGFAKTITVEDLGKSVQGSKILTTGTTISIGDVNGDGHDDLLSGHYVVFGSAVGFGSVVDSAKLADGSHGFRIKGEFYSAAAAGDMNGDGLQDIIVGNESTDSKRGTVYVIYGREGAFGPEVKLADIAHGKGGFAILGLGSYSHAGTTVSGTGDVNGDGFDDVLIGGAGVDYDEAEIFVDGTAYVVLGHGGAARSNVQLGVMPAKDGALLASDFNNYYGIGRSLAGGGDIDGDGLADMLVGAPWRIGPVNGDRTYVVYGDKPGVERSGGSGPDKLIGSAHDDTLNGGGGDDVLYGRERVDTLNGDAGSDRLLGGADSDSLYGGDGADRLLGEAGKDYLEGGKGNDRLIGGSNADFLWGGSGSDRLSGGDGADWLSGGPDRDIASGGKGADRFVFYDGDTALGTDRNDEIIDFSHIQGDKIDLVAMDADLTQSYQQSFTWIGTAAFTQTGQLHYVQHGQDIFLEGNNDTDKAPDFSIELNGASAIVKADLILWKPCSTYG